jgi:hypothetical protein
MRRSDRFDGRREAAIGLGVYAVYLGVRRLVFDERGKRRARENARRVIELERRLGIHLGPACQRACLPRPRLLRTLNLGYVTLNVVLTVGTLMRLYARRHPDFHRLRRAVALATLGAQPAFLFFPTAPPRAMDGFVDTVRELSGLDLDNGLVSRLYDPIAAMPSIHLAYAVVTAAALAAGCESRALAAAAHAYPPAVLGAVLATANHYLLDGVAGAALGAAALRLARRFSW